MKCGYCNISNGFKFVPDPRSNGEVERMSCYKCAKKNPFFCRRHQAIHLVFEDGSHVCRQCMYFHVRALGSTLRNFYIDRIATCSGGALLLQLGIYGHKRQWLSLEFAETENESSLSEDDHVLALCFSYMERKKLKNLNEVIDLLVHTGDSQFLFAAY